MKHATEGARDSLSSAITGVKDKNSSVNPNYIERATANMRISPEPIFPSSTLEKTKTRVMAKNEDRLHNQVSPDKALAVMTDWLNLFK
ncbi:MAG: hypothetical protein MZV63_15580 [Marinilabiliales bacterium]|nr:hypothetical protein [Marinilabiliales bacterium]